MIFNIMRFATHDGPGIRTTVFLKGCPLSCWWCHNPESQSFRPERLYFEERCRGCLDCALTCPRHAIQQLAGAVSTSAACTACGACTRVCMAGARQIAGRRYALAELLVEIEKDLVFFDDSGGGLTLSGGEPAAQPVFSAAILQACRERGIRTAIETCGFAQAETFRSVALLADLVMFDLKLVDPEKHLRYTGVSNQPIRTNLEDLLAHRRPTILRIPLVPGVNDADEDLADFAAYLAPLRPPAVELLPYHRIGAGKYRRLGREYKLPAAPEPSAADLERFRGALERAGLNVTVQS